MIHHASIGVRNLARACRFYDAALGALGLRRVFEDDTAVGYGVADGDDVFCLKHDALGLAPGPASHLAFAAYARADVDAFFRQALQAGGSSNGAPGLRLEYGEHYYAAFLIDPDGYRIEAVCKTRPVEALARARVSLREVDEDNFEAIMAIELPPHQRDFLDTNACSIAQTHFYPDLVARAIYADDALAGFLLYDRAADEVPGYYGIYRLMVDYQLQGRGIGRRALALALAEIRARDDVRRISIWYHPRNVGAKALYGSMGFCEVGLDAQGEMVADIAVS